ncbi:conserved hypothetical protein [Talaromyces stipitatus ATCC 10500]|uniref:Serine hydrolase domain-containing protein n=1 Tax=Talaromyces stipitatus (strain ATCC 10500 / CBS 375.48 / QM 6759 / NRRL 1006) TaxID=441959 RepID=B8MT29_TALSN|nr:uncharacterized protein TSTA_001770 [Talaromyces stipitatus ATCC 10500]EED12109.1 conserved hypothetical protein [Talaromyces stipitatus ATCC 10500]
MSVAPPPKSVSLGNLQLPRILCLHGGGVNAEVFRLQCRALFRSLNGHFRLVFPDAPYLSPADPGVIPTYAHLQPFRRWLRWRIEQPNPGPEAICQDIDKVINVAIANDNALGATGDWVAIMGFSQGAKLAASLLLRQQLRAEKLGQNQTDSSFKFGVLLADHMIRLPSLHVHGRKDPGIADHRRLLTDFCKPGTTRLVEWDGDHRVVIQPADVTAVANEILALSKQTGVI